jgi:hypothetical protein
MEALIFSLGNQYEKVVSLVGNLPLSWLVIKSSINDCMEKMNGKKLFRL